MFVIFLKISEQPEVVGYTCTPSSGEGEAQASLGYKVTLAKSEACSQKKKKNAAIISCFPNELFSHVHSNCSVQCPCGGHWVCLQSSTTNHLHILQFKKVSNTVYINIVVKLLRIE